MGKNNSILFQYMSEDESISPFYQLNSQKRDPILRVLVKNYTLQSQIWPKNSHHSRVWQHTLVIYHPDVVHSTKALLFVNGGTRYPYPGKESSYPQELNFSRIATETQSIVIDLQDVPNQYLILEDMVARKGDRLFAYSWNCYMDNPIENAYRLLSLPMTKAVIKAMDAVSQIMQETYIQIEHFVVAGISKRGLATWLAALADKRICAIVPIVIDILNTKKTMQHIYASYNNHWPPAFFDFIQEKILDRFDTKEFEKLTEIEDPLTYLENDFIPTYIISASGDDFFVPDGLSLYWDKLPKETKLRFVPNQGHFINMKIVEDALFSYYGTILKSTLIPSIQWKVNEEGIIDCLSFSKQPLFVKFWQAENPQTRDFRLTANIAYTTVTEITLPKKGWKAYFIEVGFENNFILTTLAYVISAKDAKVK